MPILLSYHVTLGRSYCDQANLDVYITHFLVKNFVKFYNMSQNNLKLSIHQWERS